MPRPRHVSTTSRYRRRARPLAHELLAMPAANLQAREDAQAFMRRVADIEIALCPHCKVGHWRVVEQRGADRTALAAVPPTACRGRP